MNDDAPPAIPPQSRRRVALLALTTVLVVAALAYGAYWWLVLSHYESTDNAYVQAPVVQVTPQVSGTVVAIMADDTDIVRAGQPLVKLDRNDAQVALERAEAQLAQTVREVRTTYANDATLAANVRQREAEVARVASELARAQEDVARRAPLVHSGAVAAEELKHAQAALAAVRSQLAAAESALAAAREEAAKNRALTEGTTVEQHPAVGRAAAAVREAWLALRRTELPAPVAGQIAKRSVQVGQRVAPGVSLMSVIPLDDVWVEANFKEVQLRQMRVGQPVELTADLYGGHVAYRGHIVGLGAGTGAAFALLPAQNATGNWIKVVQRVPVRIALDPKQLREHPLRVGLSMEATVDIEDQSGAPLALGRAPSATATTAFADEAAGADHRVREIIAANLGRAPSAQPAPPPAANGRNDAVAAVRAKL
jgi:membrane fusion protein (multidrug efflux system)